MTETKDLDDVFSIKAMPSLQMPPETSLHCQKFLLLARICSTEFGKDFFRMEFTVKMSFCYSSICYSTCKSLSKLLLFWTGCVRTSKKGKKKETNKILNVGDEQICFPCLFCPHTTRETIKAHSSLLITRHHISTDSVQEGCPSYWSRTGHTTPHSQAKTITILCHIHW